MKKLIIAAAALLLSVSAFAQFGIVAGVNLSSTNIEDARNDIKAKNITLYHVGVTYKLGLGNLLAIQPSLIYNVKGAKIDEIKGVKDVDFKTGFIELPVQVQAGFGLGKLARLYGFAEPFVGYAITTNTSSDVIDKIFDGNYWDALIKERFEYGIGLGVGVELFSHLQVSARYSWNMGNLYKRIPTVEGVLNEIKSSKPNGLMISAAYLF